MTAKNTLFRGMIPAMVAPFDDTRALDLDAARVLVDHMLCGGSDAILVNGTTGESPTLSTQEKEALLQAVIEAVAGRVPVIANVGTNCTQTSIKAARRAQELGAQGLMAVVPYYNKPPQEGMYAHFAALARAVDLPIILYNIPGRCVVNMTPETTARLARDFENIVAIKEASGDLAQIKRVIELCPDDFLVFSGDDALTFDVMQMGGHGVISTIGNVAPDRMKEIVDLCAQGDFETAQVKHKALLPLMQGLFATSNPILPKAALQLLGVPVGGVRLPLVDATAAQVDELTKLMEQTGVLAV